MNQKASRAQSRGSKATPRNHPVRFTLLSRLADDVRIAGDFNEWNPMSHRLECHQGDTWTIDLSLAPGSHQYLFVVDGVWETDPAADSVPNSFGGRNSVVHVLPHAHPEAVQRSSASKKKQAR